MRKVVPRMNKSIKITEELHKALTELGTKTDTYADIIGKLIDYYKKTHLKK